MFEEHAMSAMTATVAASNGSRAWTYEAVASAPPPETIEDHFLTSLRRLTSTLDVHGVCDAVLEGVERAFGATSAWIMLHDRGANLLRTAQFSGRGADVYAEVEIPVNAGITGLAFTRGEIQFVPDVRAEGRWFNPDRVRASGLRSVLVLPLIAHDRKMGVLGVDVPSFGLANPPTALDLKRLEIYSAQAAIGFLNASLFQASQNDRRRLRVLLDERRALKHQLVTLRDEVRDAYSFGSIVGESAGIREALTEVERVAPADIAVLLLGETGTGKELLARALHERGSRSARPFIAVNCAALPEHLVESELFGHERGAFTGAQNRKPGRFELAHRGTLFLDEVGDLPLHAQAKLLRVVQDGEVHRVGSVQPVKVDVRLVAATNHDLAARVADRRFREDLFYRLSVFPIRIPPLRERPEDIPVLARYLALEAARRTRKPVKDIQQRVFEMLADYPWPGNVRELQNVIERAVILSADGVITADTIRLDIESVRTRSASSGGTAESSGGTVPSAPYSAPKRHQQPRTLAEAERIAILEALRTTEGRVSGSAGAAEVLQLRPTTLHAKMKKLGIRRGDALRPPDAGAGHP
jgi:formate hydrogenlyase transcriptional activator